MARQLCRSGNITRRSRRYQRPGVSRGDGDLSELIRNPPCSIFVLMSRIVKRMNRDSDRSSRQNSSSINVPKAAPLVDPVRSFLRGRALSSKARPSPSVSNFLMDGVTRRRRLSRAAEQIRLIVATITRVSNRASATFKTEQLGYAVLSTSAAPQPRSYGCLLLDSMEVPALRFNDVDVQVRNIDVTCAQALGW